MKPQKSAECDAPSCDITYDHHSDDCRDVIYSNQAPREHL